MRDSGKPDGRGDLADESGEQASGQRGMGLAGSFRVDGVDAVEPEDGMKMDEAPPLVFGDFGVGQPDADAVGSGGLVELAAQCDDRAAP